MHSTQTPNTENVYALNSLNIEQFAVFVEDITVLLNDHRECCDLVLCTCSPTWFPGGYCGLQPCM